MPRTVPARLDALETHRLGLTRLVASLPAGAARRQPSPRAWSLAQLLDHLHRIDRGLHLDGLVASPVVWATSGARGALICAVLALPVRIPAPPGAASVMPSADPDLDATVVAWAALRRRWAECLGAMRPEDERRIAFRHPIVGPLCVPEALAFVLAHHRHHDAQVRRTLHALGLASATPTPSP